MTAWLLALISRALDAVEREAVLGDIAESNESGIRAIAGVIGLVARRQMALWRTAGPWLALTLVAIPGGIVVGVLSFRMASIGAIYSWLYLNNWTPVHLAGGFRQELIKVAQDAALAVLFLAVLASISGYMIGRLSQRAAWLNLSAFCLLLLTGGIMSSHHHRNNMAVFSLTFYRWIFPVLVQAAFVAGPAIFAARFRRRHTAARFALVLLAVFSIVQAADQPPVQLIAPGARKPAPNFALADSEGKTTKLDQYQGKVVLLDFWATWCHGCKEEIPWFADYQKTYGLERVAVIGASMDEGGWKVLKPFLDTNHVPYRMILADDAMAKQYGIETLPDTFLIDRKGRIAAAYKGRLIDRADVDSKIKQLLAER